MAALELDSLIVQGLCAVNYRVSVKVERGELVGAAVPEPAGDPAAVRAGRPAETKASTDAHADQRDGTEAQAEAEAGAGKRARKKGGKQKAPGLPEPEHQARVVAGAVARCVAGLASPVEGKVRVGGADMTDKPLAEWRVGYIPAGFGLLPHLTLAGNITYKLERREEIRTILRNEVTTLTARLGLVGVMDRLPHTVSAEQRLLAAVARVVLRYPVALVADLSAGDLTAASLQDALAAVDLPAGDQLAVLVCADDVALLDDVETTRISRAS